MSTGTCEHCNRTFSYRIVHNGFSDTAFAYCDTCGRTALFSLWSTTPKGAIFVQGTLPSDLEPLVLRCECGGHFRADASPRCPHCHKQLSAERATDYIERNAPGTAKGWRWQRSWQGLYAIVVEERSVEDPWDPAKL